MSCRVSWCRAGEGHGTAHWADGPTVGALSMLLMQSDVDGQPLVRVSYPAGNRGRLDLTPEFAADLADMLATVGADQVAAFSAALRQAADTLGGSR